MKKAQSQKIILFFVGLCITVYSFSIKGAEGWGVSPALFCIVCGVCLAVLSLFLPTVQEKTNKKIKDKDKQEDIDAQTTVKEQKNKPWIFVFIVLVYSFILGKIHFIIATIIFVFALTMIMDKKAYIENLIWSIATSFVVYFIFVVLFEVAL